MSSNSKVSLIRNTISFLYDPQELKAVAALKSALLTESHGQLQFHKVGKGYVIFNKGNASSEQEKRKEPKTFQTGETTELKKEGDLYTTTTESST